MSEETAIVVRCSALPRYPDCPRRGAASLFRPEIEAAGFTLRRTPRGIGAAIGTAVHKAGEVILSEKAQTGALPPVSVATDCATETLASEVKAGITFEAAGGVTRNHQEAYIQVVSMSRAYHRVIAPTVHPISIETRLEAEVSPGLILSGQSDLVAREPEQIRDLKTGARTDGSFAPQIGGYSLLQRAHGLDIKTAAIDFIKRQNIKKPQADPISKSVRLAEAETAATNVIRHIEADLQVFRHGDERRRLLPGDPWAFLANPSSNLCSPRYCPAFGTNFCAEGDPDKDKA